MNHNTENYFERNTEIVKMRRAGAAARVIAEKFGLSKDAIYTIERKYAPFVSQES